MTFCQEPISVWQNLCLFFTKTFFLFLFARNCNKNTQKKVHTLYGSLCNRLKVFYLFIRADVIPLKGQNLNPAAREASVKVANFLKRKNIPMLEDRQLTKLVPCSGYTNMFASFKCPPKCSTKWYLHWGSLFIDYYYTFC